MSKGTKFAKLAPAIVGEKLAWFWVPLLALLGLAQDDWADLFHMEFPAFGTKFTVAILIEGAEQITSHVQFVFLKQSRQTI